MYVPPPFASFSFLLSFPFLLSHLPPSFLPFPLFLLFFPFFFPFLSFPFLSSSSPYFPPSRKELEEKKTEVHYLGYYLKWTPQEAYYYAVENTGFKANPVRTEGTDSKYHSFDDTIDGFHYYTTLIKFCLGRRTYDATQQIRHKPITPT